MNREKIKSLTEKLLNYNRKFAKLYEDARENQIKEDFHLVVKPFADEVRLVNQEWKEKMMEWLKKEDPKHLHLKQIDTTSEHIEQMSIQAFFPETSRSRFINANRTVEYFLLEILKEIRQ